MRKILFYETKSGQKPIDDFLDQLPAKTAQKVTWVLKLIEDLERMPSKYFKKMVNTAFKRRPKKHQSGPLKLPKKGKKIISGGKRNE